MKLCIKLNKQTNTKKGHVQILYLHPSNLPKSGQDQVIVQLSILNWYDKEDYLSKAGKQKTK